MREHLVDIHVKLICVIFRMKRKKGQFVTSQKEKEKESGPWNTAAEAEGGAEDEMAVTTM